MIEPTVGRIVWFYKHVDDRWKGPLAAIVVEVHSNRLVNLCVFGNDGVPRAETSVTLAQPEDEVGGSDYCAWMPYQVKKATGSESGEKGAGEQKI